MTDRPKRPRPINRIPWDTVDDLLTAPIDDIARRIGCSHNAVVVARRTRRGLPHDGGPGRQPKHRLPPRGQHCEECGERAAEHRWRGLWVCDACLLGPDLLGDEQRREMGAAAVTRGAGVEW